MREEFTKELMDRFRSLDPYQAAEAEIGKRRTVNLSGLRGAASAICVSMLAEKIEGPIIWITPDFERAKVDFKNLMAIYGRHRDTDERASKDESSTGHSHPRRQAFLFDDLDLLSQDFLSLSDELPEVVKNHVRPPLSNE